MASLTQWTSLSKLEEMGRIGKAALPQYLGLQRIGHNLATEQEQQQLQEQPLNQAIARDV